MISNRLRKNVLWLTIYHICSNGFAFAIPIIVLLWKSHGLSLTSIMLLQSYFALLIVILEVPSGYLSDLWNRKQVLQLAGIFLAIASGVYLFADNYVHFMIAETFFALGISLYSGTDAAILYDTLLESDAPDLFDKIWGTICTVSLIASAVYTSLSGVIYSRNGKTPFLLSFLVTMCMFIAATLMREPQRKKLEIKKNYTGEFFRILKNAIFHNRDYRITVINFTFVLTLTHISLWFYQPFFIKAGIKPFWFGFIFTLYSFCAAFASKMSPMLHTKTDRFWRTVIQAVLIAIGLIMMSLNSSVWGFLFGIFPHVVYGWSLVSRSTEINCLVQSSERATLLSFSSMSANLVYALVLPGFGFVADNFSLTHSILLCGLISGFGALIILISRGVASLKILQQKDIEQCSTLDRV